MAAESYSNSEVLHFPNDMHLEMEGLLNSPAFEIPDSQGHTKVVGAKGEGWGEVIVFIVSPTESPLGRINTLCKCKFEVCLC